MEAAGETLRRPHARVGPPDQAGAGGGRRRSGRRPTRCGWSSGCCPIRSCCGAPPTACSTRPSRPRSRWARPPRGPGSARWSAADAVLIDEAADLIERTPSMAHIVVDEAQDLSPMQCRAIGRRCATGSATVLGDIAQGTTPWATSSWQQMLGHLGKPDADLRVLDTGYRVPRQILDFASRLLGQIAPGLARPRRSARTPGALAVRPASQAAIGWRAARRVRRRARPARLGRGHRRRRADPGAAQRLSPRPGLPHAILGGARLPSEARSRWCRSRWPRAWSSTRSSSTSRPDRDRGTARPAPALRRAHPGGLPADGAARRAAARARCA